MSRPKAICRCTGSPPWPAMRSLSVDGLNRYYLCPECSRIREEICDSGGVIVHVRFHDVQSEELPAVVVEEARAILDESTYLQKPLF